MSLGEVLPFPCPFCSHAYVLEKELVDLSRQYDDLVAKYDRITEKLADVKLSASAFAIVHE